MAGIEASTMTSLGTCRLVMPLSESTIASAGPWASRCCTAARMASPSGSASAAPISAPSPSLGEIPAARSWAPYCWKTSGKNISTKWPKTIGSETFIMVALRCTEKSTSSAWARAICSVTNSRERLDVHAGGVDDLAGQHRHRVLEHGDRAVLGDVLDAERVVGVEDHRLLAVAEVAVGHGRDVGARVGGPGAHGVRVVAGVLLDRLRRAAVGVALAEDRVDRAALDLVVAGAGVAVVVGLRLVGVGRQFVALGLRARRPQPSAAGWRH